MDDGKYIDKRRKDGSGKVSSFFWASLFFFIAL